MDKRFELVSKVPETALKKIEAGRLKGKTDINPQWRIGAVTEVYGLCGEGWKEDIIETKEYQGPDGELLLFMHLTIQYKTADGQWSEPVHGYGGDYIIKKEREGLRLNDEAYKMVETDAIGNAMKKIGVANDIFRGFWDGSKYSRTEESAIVQDPEPFKKVNDEWHILARNGQYYPLARLNSEQLNGLLNNAKYAEIKEVVFEILSTRNE